MSNSVIEYLKSKNICIIGFMCAGKTTFAQELETILKNTLIHTDKLIEQKTNMTIDEIFKTQGEKQFRKIERNILKDIVYEQSTQKKIIDTGGGLPISNINRKIITALDSINICLNPPFELILQRIKDAKRPPLYRKSRKYIFNVWTQRYFQYQKIAHITITETEIENILKTLNERIEIWKRKEE